MFIEPNLVLRSFKVKIEDTLSSTNDIRWVENYFDLLTQCVNEYLSDDELMQKSMELRYTSKGNFETDFSNLTNRPYKNKDYPLAGGNQAKSFRFIEANIRNCLLAQRQRRVIADKLAEYDFKVTNKIINDIKEDLIDNENIYTTFAEIKNIAAAKGATSFSKNKSVVPDWSVQDNYPIRMSFVNGMIYYKCDYKGRWITHKVKVPDNIKAPSGSFHKLYIYRDKISGILYMVVPYDACVDEDYIDSFAEPFRSLGIDLGKIRPFAAAWSSLDGSWRAGFSPSRELAQLLGKMSRVEANIAGVRKKIAAYEDLAFRGSSSDFIWKMHDMQERLCALREKHSRQKRKATWLFAHDIVNLAVENRCFLITFEDFRGLSGKTGYWNVSEIVEYVALNAELHGIQVWLVDINNTSHTNPFSGEAVEPRDDRSVVLSDGFVMNRDDLAALEISFRGERRRRDNLRVKSRRRVSEDERSRPVRSSGSVSGGRPRSVSRTGLHKRALRSCSWRLSVRERARLNRMVSFSFGSGSSVSVAIAAGCKGLRSYSRFSGVPFGTPQHNNIIFANNSSIQQSMYVSQKW